MIDLYIKYFYEREGVQFNLQRENNFITFMGFAYKNNERTQEYLEWYHSKVLLNDKAFCNECIVIKDMCKEFPILNKKWIQYKKTEKYKK